MAAHRLPEVGVHSRQEEGPGRAGLEAVDTGRLRRMERCLSLRTFLIIIIIFINSYHNFIKFLKITYNISSMNLIHHNSYHFAFFKIESISSYHFFFHLSRYSSCFLLVRAHSVSASMASGNIMLDIVIFHAHLLPGLVKTPNTVINIFDVFISQVFKKGVVYLNVVVYL